MQEEVYSQILDKIKENDTRTEEIRRLNRLVIELKDLQIEMRDKRISELEKILAKQQEERGEIYRLYRLLLAALGVYGHYGAIAEINSLRAKAGLEPNQEAILENVPPEFNDLSDQVSSLVSKSIGVAPRNLDDGKSRD